jgi:hypothetical protein
MSPTAIATVPPASIAADACAKEGRLGRLGGYTDAGGRSREVVAGRRRDGCMLVIDRDAVTRGDRRLVARLDADEPTGNAALMCTHYLRDRRRGRCRPVSARDLTGESPVAWSASRTSAAGGADRVELLAGRADGHVCAYRLDLVRESGCTAELRWRRHSCEPGGTRPATPATVGLREVIGALESYEPAYQLTLAALTRYRADPHVSTAVLRVQLERMRESPIVLNRRLRQAVLAAVERNGLSLSEIALRCGRVKRDRKGNRSGETSWLARRVGILPESGSDRCNPWVHSDVLALIARSGLGISPREVELG